MLVVSDTSPVLSLIQIGRGELLRDLFGTVYILRARDELLRFHTTIPAFLEVHEVADRARVESLLPNLDLGEAQSIVLAIELHADHLLMDERCGRTIAMQSGIAVIGLLGVLLLAKQRGLVTSVADCIAELRSKAGFYLSDLLVEKALEAADE